MMKIQPQIKKILIVTTLAVLAAYASFASAAFFEPVRIIAMSDLHGYLLPTDDRGTSRILQNGKLSEAEVKLGGASYMATLLAQLKLGHPNYIIVAAGDNIGGSPYTSSFAHDEPTIDVLNHMGLEVSSVGNHEFDKGLRELKRIQGDRHGHSTCYPNNGTFGKVGVDTCLQQGKFSGAKWTYLAANVIDTATKAPILPGTYIKVFPKTAKGSAIKIGFVGVTLKDTPTKVSPKGVEGLEFTDEVSTINKAASYLKSQGVNVVVALMHQGGVTDSKFYGDTTCPNFRGDVLPIIDGLSGDVDLVITGHTHTNYICTRNGRLITQSGHYGRGLTAIDLTFDPNGKLASAQAMNVPVVNDTLLYPKSIEVLNKDPKMEALIAKYKNFSAVVGNVVVGTLAAQVPLQPPTKCLDKDQPCVNQARNKTVESALGDLVADSQLAAFQSKQFKRRGQIAFVVAGSVRTDLGDTNGHYPNYPVTYAQLLGANPFHNELVAIDMTGAQIKRVLEQQWEAPSYIQQKAPGGAGQLLMPSNGFTYTWDSNQAGGLPFGQGNRVVAHSMKLNGIPIDPKGIYRVVISDFLFNGGDNFSVFKEGKNPAYGGVDIDAFVDYMRKHPNYVPVTPNRITKLGNQP